MRFILKILLLLVATILFTGAKEKVNNEIKYSVKVINLYDSINNYRVTKGLDKIKFSVQLSKVAQMHCEDLEKNYKLSKVCNLHSWSATSTKWESCCYTSDHAKAACMWYKPKEITGYEKAGYEIAYYNSAGFSTYRPLERWKVSKKGHNKVIVNEGQWAKANWKAIGVGLSEHYACVWFGTLEDTSRAEY